MRIIADLHTHTRYSHGKGTVVDNVSTGLLKGLSAIGITDHGPRSAPWVGASLGALAAMQREVREVDGRAPGIRVLAGVEANIISVEGRLDVPEKVRKGLDIVLAGLHPGVLHASGRDWWLLGGNNWAARLRPSLRAKARLINTQAVVEAVYNNQIDVITHPGYHLDIDTAELARACSQRETALEINARHGEMTVEFIRIAARQGARFVISSDAHRPAEVGEFARGISVALSAGLEPEQVLNSDRGGLFTWLQSKREQRLDGVGGWADWAEQPSPRRQIVEEAGEWSQPGGKLH